MFGNDLNWVVGGIVAAVLVPVLSWLGLPFWLAAAIAAVAFAGLVVLLAPRRLFEGIDVDAFGSDKVAFARELLAEALPAAERIRSAAAEIEDEAVRARVAHLAEIAQDVIAKIEADPASAATVRRFLSYYVPRAAEIAEGYGVLANRRAPDAARLAEVGAVIGKLEGAFVHYADSLTDRELSGLDVDLRLIQSSLKEDLGR